MEKGKILVLLRNIPLMEESSLELIATRIMAAKAQSPEILPEVKNVYVKDNNLILDINGLLYELDGQAVLKLSRRRLPDA